jgi:hypothetical protein
MQAATDFVPVCFVGNFWLRRSARGDNAVSPNQLTLYYFSTNFVPSPASLNGS